MNKHGGAGDVAKKFSNMCQQNPEKSEAAVAIEVLARLIESSDVTAVQGLNDLMVDAIHEMCKTKYSNISVQSACELFQRFITLAILDSGDFDECKRVLLDRAAIFIKKVSACRQQIAENARFLIAPGARLLVHARSRCVLAVIAAVSAAATAGSTNTAAGGAGGFAGGGGDYVLHCYVTQGGPISRESGAGGGGGGGGEKMWRDLQKLPGVSAQLVPDAALAFLMPRVDAVLLGAEAVVESGGILNRLGSATVATVASACGKPVYVMAESFKFLRCYPLDQLHIPARFRTAWSATPDSSAHTPAVSASARTVSSGGKKKSGKNKGSKGGGGGAAAMSSSVILTGDGAVAAETTEALDEGFEEANNAWERVERLRRAAAVEYGGGGKGGELELPLVDYTGPRDVTFLVTDLGVLTPSAVSDELIKLYL